MILAIAITTNSNMYHAGFTADVMMQNMEYRYGITKVFYGMDFNRNKDENIIMEKEPNNLGDIFDRHIQFEFDKQDVDATMTTMTDDPYVHSVPTLTGGTGYNGVYNFYKNHLIGKVPKDFKITNVSRTVGKDQVVDELIIILRMIQRLIICCRVWHLFSNSKIIKFLMNIYTGIKHRS